MGGGKGGSTTVNKTEIPPEVLARYNAVNARAETVAQQPYQKYSNDPNAFVAGLTPTQTAGIQNTNAMAGAAQPFYQAGAAATLGGMQNVGPLTQGQIGYYQNPYTQAVVNPTLQALQQQQGQQLAQQQAEAIRGGAFGGERAGLARAQLQGQQNLALGQAIAPLYQQGFNTAAQIAAGQQNVIGADLARMMTGGQQLANLGMGAQQAGLAGAQAQMQAGQTQQQTEQAGKQAMYNQFMQEQGYPFQVAQFLANIATGTGALSGNQSTSTTTGGGGFFSDKRLKENVEKVGETNDGQPIYRYNYKGDPRTQIGLMAQDVEKDHPEAVGLAGGYKTVDYKKATDDAVHKAEGGAATDAYAMGAPSQMLGGPQGLGALQLPQMKTQGIAVRPMTPASEIEALRAPKATGFSPGTMEANRAEAASLRSSLASGRGADLGSGPDYMQSRLSELDRFLGQNSSQGGLVGPEGGAFSRGGYAFGGGPYGVQLEPMQQRQMMQAQPGQRPAERNAVAEAKQFADLAALGYAGYKNRPDFLRSAADVAARQQTELAQKAAELQKIAWAKEHGYDLELPKAEARGGLIGNRDGFNTRGYVNSSSNPYSGIAEGPLDDTLQTQQQTPRPSLDVKGAPKAPPAKSGLGELAQLANTGKSLYKGGEWAAGKLGLDASPTAMSAATAEALPGVAAAAPEALSAGLAGGAAEGAGLAGAAGAGEALAGGAAATEGALAGLAGGAEALGSGLMAAGSAALPFVLPAAALFSIFAKDGGAIKGRDHYRAGGLKPPEDAPVAVEEAPLVADGGGDNTATGGDSGETKVPRAGLVPPLARPAPRPTPADAVAPVPAPRAREPGVASGSRPSIPDFGGLVPGGMKDTLSSENFWVPALAGIGSMLASPNKTLAGAIGSGLVGGTTAYTDLQKQQADQLMKRLEISKGRFKGPTLIGDQDMYQDTIVGDYVTEAEMARRQGQFTGAKGAGASTTAPALPSTPGGRATADVVDTAKKTITEEPPAVQPRAPAPPAKKEEAAAPAVQPDATPPAQKPAEIDPNRILTKPEMIAAARQNESLFQHLPEERRPLTLESEAKRLEDEAKSYLRQSQEEARRSGLTKGADERTRLEASSKKFAELAKDRREEAAKKRTESNELLEGAIALQLEEAKARTGKKVEFEAAPQIAPGGEKVLLAPGEKMPPVVAPEPTAAQQTAPKVAEVDPKTARLVLARPVAPAGGGLIQPTNLPPGAKVSEISAAAKNQNTMDEQFQKDFMEKAPSVAQARQRYMGLINAFKLFESGSTETKRAGWAALAQTFGAPVEIVQSIASGDPAGVQWVEKIGPNLVLETLKAATPRFAQSEFMTLQDKGTPEPNKLPQANFQMVKEGLATLNRTDAFMQAWQTASQEEGWRSPSAYYAAWSKANPIEKFEQAAERQMGNFSGMPLPKSSEWAPGAVYVVPKNISKEQQEAFAKRGLKSGDTFQFAGADVPLEQRYVAIPKQQLYSIPAMRQ